MSSSFGKENAEQDIRAELAAMRANNSTFPSSSSSSSSSSLSSASSSSISSVPSSSSSTEMKRANPFAVPEQPAKKNKSSSNAFAVPETVKKPAPLTDQQSKEQLNITEEEQKPLGEWDSLAPDVIQFKFIRNDGSEVGEFFPKFAYDFFGEHQIISGYKGLKIVITYRSDSLESSIKVSWQEKREFGACNIIEKINSSLPTGVLLDDNVELAKESTPSTFEPPGQLCYEFPGRLNTSFNFQIYKANLADPAIKKYNRRVQSFLKWFIDGVRYLNEKDDRWTIYFIFNRQGSQQFDFVGMASTYQWWAPDPYEKRIRLSQIFVLPHFQKNSVASNVFEMLYAEARSDPLTKDVVVEDASEELIPVRDLVDLKALIESQIFEPNMKEVTKDTLIRAQKELKLYGPQVKHCFESYRYSLLNKLDQVAYRQFRLFVKRRLYIEMVGSKERDQQVGVNASSSANVAEAVEKEKQLDALIKKTLHECYLLDEAAFEKVKSKLQSLKK